MEWRKEGVSSVFCPNCKDEFRSGFTHCGDCGVDLVASLDEVAAVQAQAPEPEEDESFDAPPEFIEMGDFCGFETLPECREARDLLRSHRIRSEIVIREAPGGDRSQPAVEEFWIRVEEKGMQKASELLGFDDDIPGASSESSNDPFRM